MGGADGAGRARRSGQGGRGQRAVAEQPPPPAHPLSEEETGAESDSGSEDSFSSIPTSQDSAGSLRDFIADDDSEEEEDIDDDSEEDCESPPCESSDESECSEVPAWIDTANIVTGRRRRRPPQSIYDDLRSSFAEAGYAEGSSESSASGVDSDTDASFSPPDSGEDAQEARPSKRRRFVHPASDDDAY